MSEVEWWKNKILLYTKIKNWENFIHKTVIFS